MRLLVVAALWGVSCARKELPKAPAAPAQAVIIASADMRGYLGPCGCSENMRGGIARAAHQVAEPRQQGKPVLYVDGGDSLFGHSKLPEGAVPQEERKARALAEAFKLMGLATRAVGELDDARGELFRRSLELPDQTEPVRFFELAGRKVAVVVSRDEATLEKACRDAHGKAAFVLALYHQTLEAAQRAGATGCDFVLASHAATELDGEDNKLVRASVPVAQVQSKGRSMLRLDLTFGGPDGSPFEMLRGEAERERELEALDGRIELLRKQVNQPSLSPEMLKLRKAKLEEIIARREALAASPLPTPEGRNAFSVRFIPLESSFPSLPEAKAIVTAYDRDVGQLNLAWAKEHGKDCPPPEKGKPAFAGSESCRDCHEEAFAVFEASKHAHAYQTLVDVGKNYHLDCVGCHVTGYESPGGVCRIDKVEGRAHVGCESCHGPGSLHNEDPDSGHIARGNRIEDCIGCHDKENSPHFELERYLAEVLGPGHGKPKTAKK